MRMTADNLNVKASELEITRIHEKIDQLMTAMQDDKVRITEEFQNLMDAKINDRLNKIIVMLDTLRPQPAGHSSTNQSRSQEEPWAEGEG